VRIAFVNTRSDAVGGSQVHVGDLAEALLRRGHEVRVFVGGEGPVTALLAKRGVSYVALRHLVHSIHPYHDSMAVPEMCQALREFAPDLVSTHTSKAGVVGRIAAQIVGIPSLFTAHGWNFTDGIEECNRGFRVGMERVCSRWTERVITVSESDRQLALRYRVAPSDRLVTVHNGMPEIPQSLRADPAGARARIVMVARFEAQKDHPTLLQALRGLTHLPWELELIGGGPLLDEVRQLAGRLGIANRIEFSGPRNDVAERLARAQIYTLVSNWEGLPRSIIEAMRAGLPVVASDVGGSREMVIPGHTGCLVPRGDVDALRGHLEQLLRSPELRIQLGRQGREHYEGHFTFQAMFRKTLAVYHQVLAAAPQPRVVPQVNAPRVVHVVESYGAGTAEVIRQLTDGMPEYRHVVLCGRRPESATVQPPGSNSETSAIEWRAARREISVIDDVLAFAHLLRTLRKLGDIGLLHAHSAKGGFHGRLAARILGLHESTLYTTHGSPILRRDVCEWKLQLYRALEWIGAKLAGTVVACSASEHAILTAAAIPATFVANGVDDEVRPATHDLDVVTVGTAARAAAQKDPAFFRKVAHALSNDPSLRFVWIGGGELLNELACPNIRVTGWLNHRAMHDELSKLCIYFSTSVWEGLSMGVLHAMAMSKPLVLRRCPGNVDAVEQGQNGFLFDTIEEAIDRLNALAADPDLRRRMGGRSREILLERFTSQRMLEQYRQLYRSLLAGDRPAPLPATAAVQAFSDSGREVARRAPHVAGSPRHHHPAPTIPVPVRRAPRRKSAADVLTGSR
jgi:glycosyltransferase involved in cell wall biosynthesis